MKQTGVYRICLWFVRLEVHHQSAKKRKKNSILTSTLFISENRSLAFSLAGNYICNSIKPFLLTSHSDRSVSHKEIDPGALPLWNNFTSKDCRIPLSLFKTRNMSSPVISLLQILCKRNMLSLFYYSYYYWEYYISILWYFLFSKYF